MQLAFFTQHNVPEIYRSSCMYQSPVPFCCCVVSPYTTCQFMESHAEAPLVFAIINNAAMTINVNVWTQVFTSLGLIPNSAVAEFFGIYEIFKCIFPLTFLFFSCFLSYMPSFLNNTMSVFPTRRGVFQGTCPALMMITQPVIISTTEDMWSDVAWFFLQNIQGCLE